MMRPLDVFREFRARVAHASTRIQTKDPPDCGVHPDTNIDEGHLGGYIRGRQSAVSTAHGFEHGDPQTWTPELWRWVYEILGVRSVLDIGCGEGHSAGFFRDLGCRVLGVDGSVQAKCDSIIPEHHVTHDYTKGPYLPEEEFDLVWCCEFVEHVEERYKDHYLATFACGMSYLMMTYAKPGQPGHHHVNCRPARYWIKNLKPLGFRFDKASTAETRAIASPGHYHTRGLFFVKDEQVCLQGQSW